MQGGDGEGEKIHAIRGETGRIFHGVLQQPVVPVRLVYKHDECYRASVGVNDLICIV